MAKRAAQPTVTAPPPTSNLAVYSLIAGLLGLTLFPVVGCVGAVVLGIMARREIEASDGALAGDGLATAGLVLGWIGVGIGILGICAVGSVVGISLCFALFAASQSLLRPSALVLPVLLALV